MGEPMTKSEARAEVASIAYAAIVLDGLPGPDVVECILATTDALAVLLDPETMLRAWEKAGRVERTGTTFIEGEVWRIVPDEEGATDEAR